jgi:hypothetical protein
VTSGGWSTPATWERFNGAVWVPAVAAPTSADGVITIRNGHTVTLFAPVTADQVVINAGGNLNIDQFASASGGNDLTLAGAGTQLTVNGTLLLRGFNLINGTGGVAVNGTMNWFSGGLQVPTTIAAAGVLNLDLDFDKILSSTLTNNGTVNWGPATGATGLGFNNATFTNNGTFNQNADHNFFASGGVNSFVNTGLFLKTTTDVFLNNSVPINNSGTLGGIGTYTLTGTITNTGNVNPGNTTPAAATLNVSPNGMAGTSVTEVIDVTDGSGPGTGNDLLVFTGNMDLTGTTLRVVDLTCCPPAPLGIYTVLRTSSGTFSGAPNLALPPNYSYVGLATGNTEVQVQKNSFFALPVVWGSFNATADRNKVNLSWTTLQEFNNSYFTVEYSTDGSQFASIGTVTARGNSSVPSSYSFVHASPNLSGTNYYRIRQTDINGSTKYSVVRPVRFEKGAVVKVQAGPNPVRHNLDISVQAEGVRIMLVDMNGKTLHNQQLQPGNHSWNMDGFATGIYQLVIYQNEALIDTRKILKAN